jgi:1,4-dihydroxy-2-naphthoate octaprenyltransferase
MDKMNNYKLWLQAFRLRTLPLAMASIGLGSFIAASKGMFSLRVTVLCLLTTLFLQILSNLANDYGDSVHGADSSHREGPQRLVQSGNISGNDMKKAMAVFTVLSAVTGFSLIYGENLLFFIPLGLLAITAAITYTVGTRPYGYAGLGDLSVFIFFGLVGVIGSFYLQAHQFSWNILLPAFACGFFSTAVLNINNLRDLNSDKLAGKNSLPVRLGPEKARIYHCFLLTAGLLCAVLYTVREYRTPWQLLFLLIIPLLVINGKNIWVRQKPSELDPFLKQMAITTLLFVLTFGIGNIL